MYEYTIFLPFIKKKSKPYNTHRQRKWIFIDRFDDNNWYIITYPKKSCGSDETNTGKKVDSTRNCFFFLFSSCFFFNKRHNSKLSNDRHKIFRSTGERRRKKKTDPIRSKLQRRTRLRAITITRFSLSLSPRRDAKDGGGIIRKTNFLIYKIRRKVFL